jgi:hypothetical protein
VLLRGSFDALERFYWPSVSTSLVGYELFWKTFIVLMTKRVDPLARDGWIRLRTGLPSDYERLLMANYSIFYNLVVAHAQIALRRKEVAEGRFYHPEAFFFFSRASIENFDDLTERARKLLHDGGIHLRIPGLPDALLHEIKSYRDVSHTGPTWDGESSMAGGSSRASSTPEVKDRSNASLESNRRHFNCGDG